MSADDVKAGATSVPKPSLSTNAFFHVSDLMNLPPAEFLVEGLIEENSLVMVYASPSAGKSFLALGWAASIASGHPWLGRVVKQGSVFYIAGEGQYGLPKRIQAWQTHTGVDLSGAPLYVSKQPTNLSDATSTESLIDEIEELTARHGVPKLIVIDTFARNAGGIDENATADVSRFINNLDVVRGRLGCAILIVHHTGHSDPSRARGSSALPAAMDATFTLTSRSSQGAEKLVGLKQMKSKETEAAEELGLKLDVVTLAGLKDASGNDYTSAVFVEASLTAVTTGKASPVAMDAYRAAAYAAGVVDENDKFLGVANQAWADEFDLLYKAANPSVEKDSRRKAFQRAKKAMLNAGQIEIDGERVLPLGWDSMEIDDLVSRIKTRLSGNVGLNLKAA